jgi:hypothetical protein
VEFLASAGGTADRTPDIENTAPMVPPWEQEAYLEGTDNGAFRDALQRAQANFQFVAFVDPLLPRKAQLERISRDIVGWQNEIGNRARSESAWRGNLPHYLRLLDAGNAGASLRQIADHLANEQTVDESQLRKQIKAAENAARIHIGLDVSRTE